MQLIQRLFHDLVCKCLICQLESVTVVVLHAVRLWVHPNIKSCLQKPWLDSQVQVQSHSKHIFVVFWISHSHGACRLYKNLDCGVVGTFWNLKVWAVRNAESINKGWFRESRVDVWKEFWQIADRVPETSGGPCDFLNVSVKLLLLDTDLEQVFEEGHRNELLSSSEYLLVWWSLGRRDPASVSWINLREISRIYSRLLPSLIKNDGHVFPKNRDIKSYLVTAITNFVFVIRFCGRVVAADKIGKVFQG